VLARRSFNDRIEIWIGEKDPEKILVHILKVLSVELAFLGASNLINSAKYKKHY
jgi:hypothetical protein